MSFARVITSHDPVRPGLHTPPRLVALPATVRDTEPSTALPHLALVNGVPVLRAAWGEPLTDGDLVNWIVLPRDDDLGQVVKIAAIIALATYAPTIGTSLGIGSGPGALAAVNLAGGMIINALIPPPKPTSAQQAAALANPSPTYSLQSQGNLARLDQAIPVQYGRMMCYPDLAAQPYAEYAGNEQYLYQLMCIGQGEYDVEAVRIDDTPVSGFEEISYEVIPPGGTISLFPANVVNAAEVSGQEAIGLQTGTYSQSSTTVTVTLTAHGLAVGRRVYLDFTSGAAVDGEFTVTAAPTADTFTVTAGAALTASGNVTVTRWLGGFIANGAGTQANTLGLDFIASRGLYAYDSGSGSVSAKSISLEVSYRQVDAAGSPTSAWVTVPITYTDSTTTPQRYSWRETVPLARYEVRVRRTDARDGSLSVGHEILWGGLRAYVVGSNSYAGVTLLAMRMRASNNLSGLASRKINVICTRRVPVWNGTAWSAPTASRSIAWAAADVLRNQIYGAGLADSRIDVAELQALDAVWAARGDTFDGRFDGAIGLWEALSKVLAVGRARPFMQGGLVRFARDGAQSSPVALFSPRNILAGSFSLSYAIPNSATADAVDAGYFDATRWAPQRVRAALPGSANQRPGKVELFGITDRAQALREGLYQAACNKYRRRFVKFGTEMEGFIPSLGDLIAVAHDMPAWGQSFEVVAVSGRTLTLDAAPTWGTGTHFVGLRNRDGSLDGPIVVTAGPTPEQVLLAADPARAPYVAGGEERTHLVFGPGETWRQLAVVVAVRPTSAETVEVEAVCEDSNVHTADVGITVTTPSSSQLNTVYTTPTVAGLVCRSSASDTSVALLSWQAAPGAEYYVVEMAPNNTPSTAWTRVGESTATNLAVSTLYGATTWIRVAAVGRTRGPWVTLYFGASADYMWTSDAALMWNASGTTKMWKA